MLFCVDNLADDFQGIAYACAFVWCEARKMHDEAVGARVSWPSSDQRRGAPYRLDSFALCSPDIVLLGQLREKATTLPPEQS
jgi:hypothetical protein